MTYTVSDTESLRKVNLFVWAEPYDGARETRSDFFGPQDLPPAEARARIEAFLEAARAQSRDSRPSVAAAAADAAARLKALLDRSPNSDCSLSQEALR